MVQGDGARRWRRGGIRNVDVRGELPNSCMARAPSSLLQLLSFFRECTNKKGEIWLKAGRPSEKGDHRPRKVSDNALRCWKKGADEVIAEIVAL